MTDPMHELADLAARVRNVLDANRARGHLHEPLEPSPGRADVGAGVPAPARSPEPEAGVPRAWSALARDARGADASGELALRRVREDLGDCRRCALHQGRRNLVFGVGDAAADLVVVGEAPGYQEDQQGEPFVGPAGVMLDRMLENVLGLHRSAIYILNVVKCRPPRNRNPLPDEVEACRPYLERQILALRPKLLLVLGTVAFKTLFRTETGITRGRGIWREWNDIPAMPTFHPAYLLRNPSDKRLTFADLKAVRARYDELGGKR